MQNRYQINRIIGEGSFSTVFEALDLSRGQLVAVKSFSQETIQKKKIELLIQNEREFLYKLDSPNVIKIFDFFEDNKNFYLILELCRGKTLGEFLQQFPSQRLDESTARELFREIVQGVKYIHSQNIFHRDLKVDNIMIEEDEETGKFRCFLIDFGFAIHLQPNELIRNICGTPNYMAPEIHSRMKHLGGPSDIWALGVILFRMLVGKFPFKICERNQRSEIQWSFTVPNFVSTEAKDLFSQLFCDYNSRMNLQQLEDHPWFSN